MRIRVVPRKWFLDRRGTDEEKMVFGTMNIISIITPPYPKDGFEDEDIPFSEEYRNAGNVLVVKFHDTEKQWNDDVVLMNESDADRIYEFVQRTMATAHIWFTALQENPEARLSDTCSTNGSTESMGSGQTSWLTTSMRVFTVSQGQ